MEIDDQNTLQDQYDWYAILEFFMHGFMMPYFHTDPRADAAANDGYQQKCSLRYAPFAFFSLVLIYAIHDKGDEINGYQII